MNLSKITIRNLRCVEEITVDLRDYTTLIGPNNAGKSTVLRAIEILLNHEKPDYDEIRTGPDGQPLADSIEITGTFDNILEWERNKSGVSSLVHDNQIQLRVTVTFENGKANLDPEAYIRPAEIDGFEAKWSDCEQYVKDIAGELGITGQTFRNGHNKGRIRQAICDNPDHADKVQYGEPMWTSEGFSIPEALKQALPQAKVIPAVRDVSDDSKPGAKTALGLLMKEVFLPAITSSDEYNDFTEAVSKLQDKLAAEDDDQIRDVAELLKRVSDEMSQLISGSVFLRIDDPDPEKFIGSNARLRVSDGIETRPDLQGHGAQRAMLFGLLRVLATRSATKTEEGDEPRTRSTLLLFEEPELFIHPHLMRRLRDALIEISKTDQWQVVATTHSPFLIDVADDPMSLVIHRRRSSDIAPSVCQLKEDPFAEDEDRIDERRALRAALDFHPTVCEVFFAKHAVLVEGDSEKAILVKQESLYRLAGIEPQSVHDVSIISCGGKWTIPPIARLLREFGISFRIIHDKDAKGLPEAELAEKPAIHPYHANEKIAECVESADDVFVIDDTLEHILWSTDDVSESGKDKPYRAWCRVNDICRENDDLDNYSKLRDLVKFAFGPFEESADDDAAQLAETTVEQLS